jgi:hypothetical protein
MVRVGVLDKVLGPCLAFILLAGGSWKPAAAQQPPKSHATAAPRQIILPPTVVAGEQATLAVLDSQGRLLPKIEVELSGGQRVTTDVTGRALFKGPDQPGTMVAQVSAKAVSASAIVAASPVPGPQSPTEAAPAGVRVDSYPHFLALHDRFILEGSGFRGAADSNHVSLNGEPCLVVASSPDSLVLLPGPRVPVGDVNLHVTVAGTDAGQFHVSAVLLEFSGPTEAVNAGSTGKLIVRAHGTSEPLLLEVRNGSPGVIQLSKGNVQRLKTSGGEQNIVPIEVKFVTGGNYSVSARLISPDRSQPRPGISQKGSAAGAEHRVQ